MTFGERLTLRRFFFEAVNLLSASGFESPREEARALIEAVADIPLSRQFAYPDDVLDQATLARLEQALELRVKHVPLQQITGRAWFCGLPFRVTEATLVPRPETELLVDVAFDMCIEIAQENREKMGISILDTFTGSGAIGVSLASRLSAEKVVFSLTLADISKDALEVAAHNLKLVLPEFDAVVVTADIWPPGTALYDVITANPPYIPKEDIASLMPEVAYHEPKSALDGGPDGLRFYRRLASEARGRLARGGVLVAEAGAGQSRDICSLFSDFGWTTKHVVRDLADHERVLVFSFVASTGCHPACRLL